MTAQSISILGCGWLGLALAKRLIQLGFTVNGSTTTRTKTSSLKAQQIQPFLMTCTPQLEGDELESFFKADVIFLNIPFRRDLEDPQYYKQQIFSIIKAIEASPIEFVIFAGSTSIYPDSIGEADEDHTIDPQTQRTEVLLVIEQSLLTNSHFSTTIIRFSGMYGPERQIGNFLSGKNNKLDGRGLNGFYNRKNLLLIILWIF